MKTIVTGNKHVVDNNLVITTLNKYQKDISALICGNTNNIDDIAIGWANSNAKPVHVFETDWHVHARRAVNVRNEKMVAEANAMIAFWDGETSNTKKFIELAQEKGIKVTIIDI